MPAIDGGPQNSEEYSPHLYENGVYVGNPVAYLGNDLFNGSPAVKAAALLQLQRANGPYAEQIARVNDYCNIMSRVIAQNYHFDLTGWTWHDGGKPRPRSRSEECYSACGMTACFGGWVAVSHEWRHRGGTAGMMHGEPILGNVTDAEALVCYVDGEAAPKWLSEYIEGIVYADAWGDRDPSEVSAEQVLALLINLRDNYPLYSLGIGTSKLSKTPLHLLTGFLA